MPIPLSSDQTVPKTIEPSPTETTKTIPSQIPLIDSSLTTSHSEKLTFKRCITRQKDASVEQEDIYV